MERTIGEYIDMCQWDPARFFIFSDNVFGSLIYYSHLLPLIVSLVFTLFVFLRNPRLLAARWLLITTILLSLWLFFDLILWATEKPTFTMFFWSIVNMIEPMIYAGTLLFVYAFIDEKGISFKQKLGVFILLLPTIVLASTNLNLSTYDLSNCWREAIEGPLSYYSYLIEIIFTLWILLFGMRRFSEKKERREKNKILLVTAGAVFFLLSFAMGNVVGSLLVDWEIGQYGLFGIPVFVAMLSYLLIKYNAFNVKLISTQLLVVAAWFLIVAILFLRDINTVRIVVLITIILFTILGYLLIKSVKKEVEQRERIEKLAVDLEKANARLRELDQLKSEFLSFASHQIRSPLTAINGYSSMLLQGDFGKMPGEVETAVKTIDESSRSLIKIVNEFLDISRIEQGRMKYDMADFDINKLAEEVVAEFMPNAQNKELALEFESKSGPINMNGDSGKLKQVIGNLIDNSIKYTPQGSIKVLTEKVGGLARIVISDTGIGIEVSEIDKLFSKFSRAKDAHKTNVTGTGLGLYVAKQMVEAHKGNVWVESPGKGKGTSFFIEIPAK